MKRWANEDFIAYGYRKWKWLCNHMATDHMREMSLVHRRIVARERRLKTVAIKRSKRKVAA